MLKFGLFVLINFVLLAVSKTNVIFCYYGSWSVYRNGLGKVDVTDFDPNLCTHFIYSFVGITSDAWIKVLDSWRDIDLKGYKKLADLKVKNSKLKNLIAIGGWNEGSENFSIVAADEKKRMQFARNAAGFVKKYGFDGMDIDWEYPADRGGASSDKVFANVFNIHDNFVKMLSELSQVFKREGLLLTAAVGTTKQRRITSYNVIEMNKNLDYINLMAYDIHTFSNNKTGHNAPLYSSLDDLSIDSILRDWIDAGAEPEKLVLGLALYGRSFTLTNKNNHANGASSSGPGAAGKFTQEPGSLSYLEICTNLQKGWTEEWDSEQMVPYAFHNDQWVGYDNERSLALKIDTAKKYKIAGVMVWSIEQDDIRNNCGGGKYPLLTIINNQMASEIIDNNSMPPPISNNGCPKNCSYFGDLKNCSLFYQCVDGVKYKYECAEGLFFDKNTKNCNFAERVTC